MCKGKFKERVCLLASNSSKHNSYILDRPRKTDFQ